MIRPSAVVTSLGLVMVTSVAHSQAFEARIGAMLLASRQNVLGTAGLDHSSGSIAGAEFLVRNDAVGLYGRYLTGEVGNLSARGTDGRLRMADVRVMFGAPIFSVEAGYTLRTRSGSLAKPRDNLIRGGVRSGVWLGPSGFSLSLSASALARADHNGDSKKVAIVGWEGLSALMYQAPKGMPFYLMLGYRYERLRTEEANPPIQREELSSIVVGAGFRHLGFRKRAASTAVTPQSSSFLMVSPLLGGRSESPAKH